MSEKTPEVLVSGIELIEHGNGQCYKDNLFIDVLVIFAEYELVTWLHDTQ